MRPGYLGNLDRWFNGFAGEYWDISQARSARPIFISRDQVYGKTAREYKAYLNRGGPISLNIPYQPEPVDDPYDISDLSTQWAQLVSKYSQ